MATDDSAVFSFCAGLVIDRPMMLGVWSYASDSRASSTAL